MKIKSTKFKGLKIVFSPVHRDNRGFLKKFLKKNFSKHKFVFTCTSSSKKCFERITFSKKECQGKYLNVLKGKYLMLLWI